MWINRLHNDLERAKREQAGGGAVALDLGRLLGGSPAQHGMRIHVNLSYFNCGFQALQSIVLHFFQ